MDPGEIINAVQSVTKSWAKQRKAEERHANAVYRRRDAMIRSRRITVKEAAYDVMKAAYLKASSNGQYPAHARQIMYAARGEILRRTGNDKLNDQYFCQTLLPDYLSEFPDKTATWDVVFDARGHFEEPHTKKIVPLGTLDVRRYLRDIGGHLVGPVEPQIDDSDSYPTCGPEHRFSAILFIEKEGFMPLFRAVHLAEKHDLAIMSTKGMSVTASRLLVDQLCEHGIPLLICHDFDKSGFSISGTLRRNTRRYAFENDIRVIDLGLRLEDVQEWELEAEDVSYGNTNPADNLRENGATDEEIAFLCPDAGDSNKYSFDGQRVELNAFSSGDLVSWLEEKLEENDIEKVVPDADTLEHAYRRAATIAMVNKELPKLLAKVRKEAKALKLPDDIAEEVAEKFEDDPTMSWDKAVAELVTETDE